MSSKTMKKTNQNARHNIGIALFTGSILGGLAFIGAYAGNFLWYWQQQYPSTLSWSGAVSLVGFIVVLWIVGKKGIALIESE